MRKVFIRNLELQALIGIHVAEKKTPQRILVTVEMTVDEGNEPLADSIEQVVSYEDAIRRIEALVAAGHVNLVETLAEKIAASCLADRRVAAVYIRVEKPDIIATAAGVGVEIERER